MAYTGLYNADGQKQITIVSGSTYTGVMSPDGQYNGVLDITPTVYKGVYHPCGAYNVQVTTNPFSGTYAPDGSLYIISSSNGYVVNGNSTRFMVVSTKAGALAGLNGAGVKGDVTHLGETARIRHMAPAAYSINNPVLTYSNWRVTNAASPEIPGANNILVKTAIEYNGTFYPATFSSGQRTATIPPSTDFNFDPIQGLTIPAGAFYYERPFVSVVNAGETWPISHFTNNVIGEGTTFSTGTDVTDGGVITPSALYSHGFTSIRSSSPSNTRSAVIVGDSLAFGLTLGTGTVDTGDANDFRGMFERAFTNNISYLTATRPSHRGDWFAGMHGLEQILLTKGTTDFIYQFGRNDVTAARTTAQMQANMLSSCTDFNTAGLRCWVCTITPSTTSTDSWVTTVNQSFNAGQQTNRIGYNDWIRDGCPTSGGVAVAVGTIGALRMGQAGHPVYNYFEVADVCESARNSGLWPAPSGVATTTDGTHPTVAQTIAMAGTVSVSRLLAS